ISLQKFRQKALKQTKQKKSKSAEFLMVKEDREATEGIGNPAFNVSSPDLLAHQTSDRKVIRRDTLDRTLAAHQQKCRLLASAEPKGNEYSRNYFDPLMDEEINPRQCGMEVSREGELELKKPTSTCNASSVFLTNFISFLFSSMQDLKCGGEGLSQYIPMSCLNTDKTFGKYVPSWWTECILFYFVERSQAPQHLQVRMKCARGLKNKAPRGSYSLRVSLLGRPGGCVFQWQQTEQLKTRTHPVRHDGNFYDLGLYFHESLYVALPPKKDVKPGMAFLFELCLLRGKYTSFDWVVGWAAFPVCDNNFDVVDGKFKCPLLRGHYDQKFDSFRKMEDLMCRDLDHWLCNLYFQVIKLPLCLDDQTTYERQTQLPPEFPVSLMAGAETAESGVENTAGLSEKQTEENICSSLDGSISNKFGPCPMDCDLNLLKEDRELHKKRESLINHSVKEKSAAWRTGELEDYSEDVSYLEELEKHRFSVWCSSVADGTGSREFFKHLHFGMVSAFSELQFAEWRSQGFWYIILLMASLWFLRLYLHYLSQWLFLQAISIPVTKFHFSPFTVELCYPSSSLAIKEELLVVVVGPLMLNAVILPLVLIRWGCQLLFASCPDVLSKLIITMGLWTVLDPLAVFIVDTVLGRLTQNGETPVADAAKLYWVFVRTTQSGILGVMLTVLIYILLFIISSLILYLYCLRLHNDSWILDVFQRIHSEETKFFIPYDLEISNQELSYIVKRSEQWRGINGDRRKVAVYDYIWKNHGFKSRISSCDLQKQNEISVSALGPGDIISHVSIYTVYPSGFQELYRHFLRLPSGAIVEVFGDISGLRFIPTEVATAIQEHISEMDGTLEDSFDIKSREMKRIH
uniref:Orofacial cleft 1 candidate gene 1 protein n=2 Tax=Felis catus TaxID=9685 RepID=A0ABI7Z182_FELCA